MKMKLLEKRNKNWIIAFGVFDLILTCILIILTKVFLELNIDIMVITQLAVASTIICLVLSFLGYFGVQIVFWFLLIGIVCGLIYMGYIFSSDHIELKGVIGLIALFEVAAIGGIVGINVQLINYLIKKRRKLH